MLGVVFLMMKYTVKLAIFTFVLTFFCAWFMLWFCVWVPFQFTASGRAATRRWRTPRLRLRHLI